MSVVLVESLQDGPMLVLPGFTSSVDSLVSNQVGNDKVGIGVLETPFQPQNRISWIGWHRPGPDGLMEDKVSGGFW